MASSLRRGGGSAAPPFSLGRGGGSAAAAACGGGFDGSPSSMDGLPASPAEAAFDGSYDGSFPALFDAASVDASSPGSWDKQVRPPGGFMSYFANLGQNSHLIGAAYHISPSNQAHRASSPPEVEMVNGNEPTKTEKRIMWTLEEDIRLMSVWVENSTNSSCGADRAGNQYWSDVVEYYNKTTEPLRKRNLKQCKDRWHKIKRNLKQCEERCRVCIWCTTSTI
ncbi:hypothetical protein EJB05_24498, partial [Eragrostis curvula]